jgi:hypothetical protein
MSYPGKNARNGRGTFQRAKLGYIHIDIVAAAFIQSPNNNIKVALTNNPDWVDHGKTLPAMPGDPEGPLLQINTV